MIKLPKERIEKSELDEVRKWLEYGEVGTIARKFGKEPSYGSQVLLGKVVCNDLLNIYIEKAIENKARIINGIQRLKAIA
jgi:hypothetical protein